MRKRARRSALPGMGAPALDSVPRMLKALEGACEWVRILGALRGPVSAVIGQTPPGTTRLVMDVRGASFRTA